MPVKHTHDTVGQSLSCDYCEYLLHPELFTLTPVGKHGIRLERAQK